MIMKTLTLLIPVMNNESLTIIENSVYQVLLDLTPETFQRSYVVKNVNILNLIGNVMSIQTKVMKELIYKVTEVQLELWQVLSTWLYKLNKQSVLTFEAKRNLEYLK
ncbi:hypothetical protein TTHERM_000467369 (macronuclear) [Tetrahymena thermophila SB210]|uniref:Uncharacterized protein n=1 Tax=Tetrahymena thermophila (strain SB210) TaxID=312017 RepID=W7WY15_TETTS|nr:hypothetical protein TTHERM_000467369 [Tetrahymena thermophila SB210]EWS71755.1 hypothetical protein TTHERM_000467369 [Tetrahymena thermophila SB210]|eukprot:XP_012655708.1 hypothetical protein TTHERM_000467369 [Tetrahymena thermophila SB210]